jgi:hypothetical protein
MKKGAVSNQNEMASFIYSIILLFVFIGCHFCHPFSQGICCQVPERLFSVQGTEGPQHIPNADSGPWNNLVFPMLKK